MTERPHTEAEVQAIAREVAREVVRELLDGAGVGIEDLIYLRRQREGSEQAAAWIKKSAITLAVTGVVWAVWNAITAGVR